MHKIRFLVPLLLVLSVVLVGCSTGGGNATPTPAGYPPPPASTVEGYPPPPQTAPTALPTAYPEPTQVGAAPAPPAPPTPRQELTATDPSSVQLASGQVQVLEFFAFW